MKNKLVAIAGLALASAALAQVNPARPMVTGRGNTDLLPGKVIVTNQTNEKTDLALKLDKFVVTGSILPQAAKEVRRR